MSGLSEMLRYGAIGLGLALAILTYALLIQEQKLKTPRRAMIRAVYVFMGFSLTLSLAGLLAESLKGNADQGQQLLNVRELAESREIVSNARAAIAPLLDLKEGQIANLRTLPVGPSSDGALLQILSTLDSIDGQLQDACNKLAAASHAPQCVPSHPSAASPRRSDS